MAWTRWTAVLAVVLVVVAGCGGRSSPTPTPRPTPVPPSPTPAALATPNATRTIPPNAIVVQPPDVYLVAESGEQKASFGAYYWVHESGYGADVTSKGFEIQPEPLAVRAGEAVHVEFRGDPAPEQVVLDVFPEAGNKDRIAPQEGALVAFIPTTDPVISAQPDGSNGAYVWVVDLQPGTYFVRLRAEWAEPPLNPVPGRKPTAEYSFYVTVQ